MSGIIEDVKEELTQEVKEVIEIVKDKLDYNDDGRVNAEDFIAMLRDYIDKDKDGKCEISEIYDFAKGAYHAVKAI